MNVFIFKKIGGGRTLKSLLLVLLLGVVGLMNAQNTENRGGDWYYYDDGSCIGSLVNGNNPNNQICCGVMFPSGFYSGDILTKVSIYNRDRDDRLFSGSIIIFNDGETAPQSPVASMNIETTPIGEFVEYTFNQPVQIDPTKNVWVIMDGIGCAPVCANTGNPNGRWDYHSGVWQDLVSLGLEGTFMIRAYFEDSAPTQTITEIYINGYTAPAWGAHPDTDVTIPDDAHCALDAVTWYYDNNEMWPDDFFDDETGTYFMELLFTPEEGYEFDPDVTLYFNGDASVHDGYYNSIHSDGTLLAYTIDYHVTYDVLREQDATALSVYPNPAKDVLRIEGLESNATIEIYNSLGMMVRTLTVTADEEINIGDLQQGIYMLRCGKQTVRFVKE